MKIQDGRVTILFDEKGMEIEIVDNASSTTFVTVKLNPQQTVQALGRLGRTTCELEVFGLDRVGKKMVMEPFEFELSDEKLASSQHKEQLSEIANKLIPEGWFCDNYYSSQGSFFKKDGKQWARTTIRQWI